MQISLCRGAANVQDKQWGAIITWASETFPYLASGEEIYNDLINAYTAGAEYLIIFNFPQICEYGALNDNHFLAMEQFWDYMTTSQQHREYTDNTIAFVLPNYYGWGFRHVEDNIWGYWAADCLTSEIWGNIDYLIEKYGFELDIIYAESSFDFEEKYEKIYFWTDFN